MERHDQPSRRDRGSAFVLTVLITIAMAAAVVAALPPVLGDLHDRQRARSAADAAALAGVVGGRAGAVAHARANDATLVSFEVSGATVTVTVRVGDQHVSARATDAP
jgi:hypothetical protein